MNESVPSHRRSNESCLEPYREQIAACRRQHWPYRRLARWLVESHQLKVHWSSVRNFCLVRDIRKGQGETPVTTSPASRRSASFKKDDFNFDTTGPLKLTPKP